MEQFLELRISHVQGLLVYDISSVSIYSKLDYWVNQGHKPNLKKLMRINIGLVTNLNGLQLCSNLNPIDDIITLQRTIKRILLFKGRSSTFDNKRHNDDIDDYRQYELCTSHTIVED